MYMPDEIIFTVEQKEVIEAARRHLEKHHAVDTSALDEMSMVLRLVLITDIAGSKGMAVKQALAEYGDRFLDLTALIAETPTEG